MGGVAGGSVGANVNHRAGNGTASRMEDEDQESFKTISASGSERLDRSPFLVVPRR